MIEAKIYQYGKTCKSMLRIDGSRKEVFFEFAYIARNLHDSLLKSDHDAAAHFRAFTKEVFSDSFFWSAPYKHSESCFIDLSQVDKEPT